MILVMMISREYDNDGVAGRMPMKYRDSCMFNVKSFFHLVLKPQKMFIFFRLT
jgi:hypothetical protein